MDKYMTISAKVRRELLEEAMRLGIDVSRLIMEALEEEVRQRKLIMLEKKLKEKRHFLSKINVDEIVILIRKDRETR